MFTLPNLRSFTDCHPRFVGLIGFALFITTLNFLLAQTSVSTIVQGVDEPTIKSPESALLTPPDRSNQAAVSAYEKQVKALAVQSETLTVGEGCAMSPLIIRLPENSVLKIDNKDSKVHTIAFEDQNFFNVSAGKVRELNITEVFGKGEGIYRYRCNDQSLSKNVGVMYIAGSN